MAKRKLTEKLVDKSEIKEELRLINESDRDYITPSGKVYADYGNNKFYLKTPRINEHNGYVYIGIHISDGVCVQRRLHRILAIAYIPNPYNLPYVMHIDNDKTNYDLTNLKWGTESENTQQAVDDGLMVNDKGFEDSQSIPINMYDLFTTKLIKSYGSVSQASQDLNIEKSSIFNSCNNKYEEVRKPYYFRYALEGNVDIPRCVGMYDFDTDQLLDMFINCAHASQITNISPKTISHQVSQNRKPKNKFKSTNSVYFLPIYRR